MDNNLKDMSRKTLFEARGDKTSKSSIRNTKGKQIMLPEENINETRIKIYLRLEWSLVHAKKMEPYSYLRRVKEKESLI